MTDRKKDLWRMYKIYGTYIVRVSGCEDQKFYGFKDAANNFLAHEGSVSLIGPLGDTLVYKGSDAPGI